MSQQRTRKAVGVEPISRGRAAVKTSANIASSNVQPKQRQRSRSKNKIPKTLRYDLENALVGLCDVWFADIKPHLVRNNIKLHVHAGEVEPASGDHRQLPPGAPGCTHYDPAAAASACELCRLLFNAANSIESAVSQAASAVVPIAGFIASETSNLL